MRIEISLRTRRNLPKLFSHFCTNFSSKKKNHLPILWPNISDGIRQTRAKKMPLNLLRQRRANRQNDDLIFFVLWHEICHCMPVWREINSVTLFTLRLPFHVFFLPSTYFYVYLIFTDEGQFIARKRHLSPPVSHQLWLDSLPRIIVIFHFLLWEGFASPSWMPFKIFWKCLKWVVRLSTCLLGSENNLAH